MSILLDVLLTEQLVDKFVSAMRKQSGMNAALVSDPTREADIVGDGGTAVRIETTSGGSLLVTPRRIAREVGELVSDIVVFTDLVGYDWISPDLAEKVRLEEEHYDRLYLYSRGSRQVVLDGLGPAVYPLMAYLAKVLELRSQKVLLRGLDEDVVSLVHRCLHAGAEGPFFTDEEIEALFGQDRGSLRVVAAMWPRMNLASPDLRRTVVGVVEMLLRRREALPEAWETWVGTPPDRVRAALEVFRRVVGGEVGPPPALRAPPTG